MEKVQAVRRPAATHKIHQGTKQAEKPHQKTLQKSGVQSCQRK